MADFTAAQAAVVRIERAEEGRWDLTVISDSGVKMGHGVYLFDAAHDDAEDEQAAALDFVRGVRLPLRARRRAVRRPGRLLGAAAAVRPAVVVYSDAINRSTRDRMSSRIGRTCSMVSPAGSSRSQSS